ncbi:hypothetical protein CQ016_11680 [Arthrobacter sp. MYb222]|nr:hypothetical protein CQ016_11680 [Arthrobacter sp. MYb222]
MQLIVEFRAEFRLPMPIAAAFRLPPKQTELPGRLLGVGVLLDCLALGFFGNVLRSKPAAKNRLKATKVQFQPCGELHL